MKHITKFLLAGAVVVAAIAISTAPSEAAKKKAKVPALCTPGFTCSSGGKVMACGGDGKWYPAFLTPICAEPFCPPKCG